MADDNDVCPFYINISMHESSSDENESGSFAFPPSLSTSNPSLEELTFRRVITVEKECLYPVVDFVFIKGHPLQKTEKEEDLSPNNGTYIRMDDVSRPANGDFSSSRTDRERGYLLFAFKSMEDLHSARFLSQWKAWTGAKYLYHMLPLRLHIEFMAFFKKVSGALDFEFLLVAHVPNLLIEAATALNLLHYMRQKVCAHIAAYKVAPFELTPGMARKLHISRDFCSDVTTTCMRMTYCNNTATLSFPGEASVCVTKTMERFIDDSEDVETNRETNRRNSITRTISIYDFPSIDESSEQAFTFRPFFIVPSIIHPFMVTESSPFLLSPNPPSSSIHTTYQWSSTYSMPKRSQSLASRERDNRKLLTAMPLSVLLAHPELRTTQRRPFLLHPGETVSSSLPPVMGHFRLPPSNGKPVCSQTGTKMEGERNGKMKKEGSDEARLRKLREAYFNSPDYDRSERPVTPVPSPNKNNLKVGREGSSKSTPSKESTLSRPPFLKQPDLDKIERKSI